MAARGRFTTSYRLFDDWRSWDERAAAQLAALFRSSQVEVVHFHHYYRVGIPLLALARRSLPRAAIVLTLHDLKLLCPANGYMLRREAGRAEPVLCRQSFSARCLDCCGGSSITELEERVALARSLANVVDVFVAPSRWVATLYAEWGLPAERIAIVPNGHTGSPPPATPNITRSPVTFGFLARATPVKGLRVLLDAVDLLDLDTRSTARFTIHSSEPDEDADIGRRVASLVHAGAHVRARGGYQPDEVAQLMAEVDWVVVPSVWWENAPLVIQESFASGRPVICSDVGGMAEHVRHGVDGLHFPVGDAAGLAAAIRRACGNQELWARLRGGIRPVRTLDEHREDVLAVYREALRRRSSASTET